ncbi:prohibitin family protein [Nitratireductor sp. B36]|uniref:prohibitin family protein n=1 Tax=Nitratireductor sp. B36 TaxID=2762059 RepID=UPI001E2910BE|nr:prohibitin family protein [Nitratireductor sp. B36]MCC5780558.1 prohibitin family protein [Nitratireductor sp. B36]
MRAIFAGIASVFALIITITVVFGSWYTIDQGERGVLLRNGALIGTAEPGLGFKTPWIEDVVEISVQSQVVSFTGDSSLPAYSRDQQPAVIGLSVNFRIPPDRVGEVYSDYGGVDGLLSRLLYPQVREEAKTVFGRFNAVTAIQERARLNQEVAAAIQEAVRGPITVDSVQIENIDFSDAYEQSIEQRMLAEVEVQKLRQNAEREKVQAEITVTQAKAKADAVRAEAEAQAEAIRIKGDAEADAIKARGDALRDNPGLVALTQAERWNGVLPTTMLPTSSVPMLSLQR